MKSGSGDIYAGQSTATSTRRPTSGWQHYENGGWQGSKSRDRPAERRQRRRRARSLIAGARVFERNRQTQIADRTAQRNLLRRFRLPRSTAAAAIRRQSYGSERTTAARVRTTTCRSSIATRAPAGRIRPLRATPQHVLGRTQRRAAVRGGGGRRADGRAALDAPYIGERPLTRPRPSRSCTRTAAVRCPRRFRGPTDRARGTSFPACDRSAACTSRTDRRDATTPSCSAGACHTRLSNTIIVPSGASIGTDSSASCGVGLRLRKWLRGTTCVRRCSRRKRIETPRDVDALRRGGPRFRNEDLIGVHHARMRAGADDVRRQVAEQRGPADHRANQAQRRGMFDELGEHRVAVQHVPHTLIGVAVVEAEVRLLAPLREIVSGCFVERGPRAFDLRPNSTRRRRDTSRKFAMSRSA